jgi:putative endonuclease
MTSFETGRRAEAVAADFLRRKGCTLIAQNWRTRYCEIDIVAQRGAVVYFCEVKYRRTARQGSGLEYVTAQKVRQMRLSARHWLYENKWRGTCQLCAIEVSGSDFRITNVVKDIY